MKNYYQDYKNLHDSIKPIRGRAVDVRPIGQRRRDWEVIEMDKDVVACRLHNTQVVRYYPDGRIGVQCAGWHTPSTAEFIHIHSPWQCIKRNNQLWVLVPSVTEKYNYCPIPNEGELQFEANEAGHWTPLNKMTYRKRVINRERAKAVREPYKLFLQWAKAFLSMADGWIMNETRKQVIPFGNMGFEYAGLTGYTTLSPLMRGSEEDYLKALCLLLMHPRDALEQREVGVVEVWHSPSFNYKVRLYDMRFDYETLARIVRRVIDTNNDIYDTVEVEVSNEAV